MERGADETGKQSLTARVSRWVAGGIAGLLLAAGPSAVAQEEHAEGAAEEHEEGGVPHFPLEKPERLSWSFSGPLGIYVPAQLRRGLQVYREVCAACHGLSLVAFRTLAEETGPHLTEEAMRELAAAYQVPDADTGELRPGRPADYFPPSRPFGAIIPPDLSLMAKARGVSYGFPAWLLDAFRFYQEGGVDYIHAFLTGYEPTPPGVEIPTGTFYNPHFVAAAATAMPPMLRDNAVQYEDGTPQTLDQHARDVAAFLMWTAEPKLVDRKHLGFTTIIFLVVLTVLLYLTKRQLWSKVKH